MEHLKLRAADDCQAYMKPGVNFKEEEKKVLTSCGPVTSCLTSEDPNECTESSTTRCKASDECQKDLQKFDDMWKVEEIKNMSFNCKWSFVSANLVNILCHE